MAATVTLAVLLLGVAVSRLVYPFDVGHYEACIWTPAMASAQGKNPYDLALSEPFATAPYGYFYYLTVGVGLRLFGWQFWFGRALTVLAAAVCVYCLSRIVLALTENRQAALLSALIFLATIPLHHWLGVHRPDLPALALAFVALAIVFASDGESRFRLPLVIALLASAFFFKQTALLPIAVAVARCWQLGQRKSALIVLVGTVLVIVAIAAALNATSANPARSYFWQHFVLAGRVPHSYAMAGHWLLSLFKSATTWIVSGLIVAALVAGKDWLSNVEFKAWLKSPICLWSCYLVAAFGFAFVTSSRAGAYINYYLETSIVAAAMVGLTWQRLVRQDRWQRFYPALVLLVLLAGVFEFSRMARAELYRWRSLPYYRELVATLKDKTPPDSVCVSVHPELVIAAGRRLQFGDWIQYHDGRSPELRRVFADGVNSGRYAAIVWVKPDDPNLPGYKAVTLQTPLPEKHYPVFLLLPEQ